MIFLGRLETPLGKDSALVVAKGGLVEVRDPHERLQMKFLSLCVANTAKTWVACCYPSPSFWPIGLGSSTGGTYLTAGIRPRWRYWSHARVRPMDGTAKTQAWLQAGLGIAPKDAQVTGRFPSPPISSCKMGGLLATYKEVQWQSF